RVSGQCSHECFLWNVDRTDSLHALLTSLLLFQKLALTRNIAAVALRQHVLTHSANILTADDFRANGRLNRNPEMLTRNQFLQLLRHLIAIVTSVAFVHDSGESINWFASEQDNNLDQVCFLLSSFLVVQATVAI